MKIKLRGRDWGGGGGGGGGGGNTARSHSVIGASQLMQLQNSRYTGVISEMFIKMKGTN